MYWWVELGYPDAFDLGKDGMFPRPGQVVKYYRERKMDDKGKPWTQKNLAKTLGLTDNGVRDIENRDVGMDDFGRRQFLCKLFGIPPILLGIVSPGEIDMLLEQQQKANNAVVLSTANATSRRHTIDIKKYQERLDDLWGTFLSDALHTVAVALASIDELQRELLQATQEQLQLQGLLRDYHVFLSALRSEQCQHNGAVEHLYQA